MTEVMGGVTARFVRRNPIIEIYEAQGRKASEALSA